MLRRVPDLLPWSSFTLTGALAAAALAAFSSAGAQPPIVSPDVPLEFVTNATFGGGAQDVYKDARWIISADFHDDMITDAEGPHVRKLFRRATGGGPTEEIWDGSHPVYGLPTPATPRVWAAYDDGAVLFSLAEDLLYVARPGECRRWTLKVNDETWLPIYGDVAGVAFRPLGTERTSPAYYVPCRRDCFDLDARVKITGDEGMCWAEPLVKRYGDVLVWLDWPSWDQQPPTRYHLAAFDLGAKAGWGEDIELPAGNARLEHFDGRTVQVSGKRYDAATGKPE